MKRLLLLLIAVFFMTDLAWSSPVDSMKAKSLAQTFYRLKFPEQALPVFEEISHSVGVEHFYIFNNVNGPGFVLVSGDDCAIPILGYSGASNCKDSELPDNIRSWFGFYDGTIAAAIQNGEVATPEIAEQWNLLRTGNLPEPQSVTVVSPLLSTTWSQEEPYNNLCPGTGSNKTIVGCVATAMAQLMKYYNWPTTGTGSYSYLCNDGTYNYGTLSANFGATTYDWNNMLNSYPSASSGTTAQQNAVATLMYHCGVAVNMHYTPTFSGAYTTDVEIANSPYPNYPTAEKALKTYFDYSSSLIGRAKASYTDAQWISMLKSDLDNAHPLIYDGTDQNEQGGHCFVCDGYDNSNNFHFNWGWNGWYDGYYALSNMTPVPGGSGGGNYDYSYHQTAIFGAVPNGGVTPPNPTDCEYLHYPLPTPLDFYVLQNSGGYVSGTNYYGDLAKADYFTYSGNGTVESLNVTFGAIDGVSGSLIFTVWADNNGTPGNVLGSKTVTLGTVYNASVNQGFNYECVFDSPIAINGNFFAGVDFSSVSSPVGILTTTNGAAANTGWELQSDGQWVPYNSSSSWGMSLSHAIHPYVCPVTTPGPPVGDYQLVMFEAFNYTPNPLQQGQSVTVSASVGNAGNNAFNGSFKLALLNANNIETQVLGQQSLSSALPSMQYTPLTFSGTVTVPAGTYQMALYYQATGQSTWTLVGNDFGVANPVSVTVTGGSTPPNPTDCNYLHYPLPSTTLYSVEDGGYISGSNVYGDEAKADYFTFSGNGSVEKIKITIGAMDGTDGSVAFTVWADNNGTPGAVLGSKTVALSTIYSTAVSNNGDYECVFDSPIAVSGNFFAGLDISNATSYFGLVSTTDGTAANTAWDYYDGEWWSYTDSWEISVTNAIFPYVCLNSGPNPPVTGTDLNMFTDFLYTPNPMQQNTVAYVTLGIINTGSTAFTGNLRLALETSDGEHVQTIQQIPVTTPIASNNYAQFNFTGNITATPGFYNLILYHKPTGGSSWMTVGSNYNASYQNPKSILVAYPDGIDDHFMDAVKLRPNPATDHFFLDTPEQTIDKIEISTSTGKVVHTQKNVMSGESIDISFLRSGVYFVRYETSGYVGTLKLIVQ